MALPKEIADFMARYNVTSDEVWKIPQGTAYAIKHKALERVAAEQGVKFDKLTVAQIDLANKIAAVAISGTLGDRVEFSTGEAAPYNCKNGYPLAMAEKRAKDRVALKLLSAHGALYSEEEADEFKQNGNGSPPKRENPHVTKPEDITDPVEYDEQGNPPADNIPLGDPGIERLPKAKARPEADALNKEMHAITDVRKLDAWRLTIPNRVESLPSDWAEIFRGRFRDYRNALLAEQKAA
jgi:hypothetical protein